MRRFKCPRQMLQTGGHDGEELVSVTQPGSGCPTEARGSELTATVTAVTHPEKTDNLTQTCGDLGLTLDMEVAQSQDAAEGWGGRICSDRWPPGSYLEGPTPGSSFIVTASCWLS